MCACVYYRRVDRTANTSESSLSRTVSMYAYCYRYVPTPNKYRTERRGLVRTARAVRSKREIENTIVELDASGTRRPDWTSRRRTAVKPAATKRPIKGTGRRVTRARDRRLSEPGPTVSELALKKECNGRTVRVNGCDASRRVAYCDCVRVLSTVSCLVLLSRPEQTLDSW